MTTIQIPETLTVGYRSDDSDGPVTYEISGNDAVEFRAEARRLTDDPGVRWVFIADADDHANVFYEWQRLG